MRWHSRLFLSIASALFLLGFLEAVARTLPAPSAAFTFHNDYPSLSGDRLLAPHAVRFFTPIPDYRYAAEHRGRYATGEWPFRGTPPLGEPNAFLRVAVLGDSCVYGTALDPDDSLPGQLAASLTQLGFGPDRVEVLNLGVPGYSSLQILLLLEELLPELKPDFVVVYPAAWNDQAPALGMSDAERAARSQLELPWHQRVLARSALLARLASLRARSVPEDTGTDSWSDVARRYEETDERTYGPRVTPEELDRNLDRMASSCAAHGTPLLFIAPAHPADTATRHPRTRSDAKRVIQAAQRNAIACVDAERSLRAAAHPPATHFIDFVHPSPIGTQAIASDVGAHLATALRPMAAPQHLEVLDWSPRRIPMLGDAKLLVTLSEELPELPSISIGYAPLMDVESLGSGRYRGWAIANRAGEHALIVRTRQSAAHLPGAVHYEPPVVSVAADRASIQVRSRPGDRVLVTLTRERLVTPLWRGEGLLELDLQTLVGLPLEFTCGDTGVGAAALPAGLDFRGHLEAQACVIPPLGFDDPSTYRWSPCTTLEF